jgi:hypothetical protein
MPASSVTALRGQSQPSSTRVPAVDEAQSELPLAREASSVAVPIEMIRAKKNKGAAFTLACDASGLDDKEVFLPLGIDKALFSRIKSGSANLDDDLIDVFCRIVGNRIYPEWLAFKVGCSLVEIETETQRQLREARERIQMLEHDKRVLTAALRGGA